MMLSGDKSAQLSDRIRTEIRRDHESHQREQTAATILAALMQANATMRAANDGRTRSGATTSRRSEGAKIQGAGKAGNMANPNPNPETRFKKGQSGNPSGLTKEQAEARDLLNAELDTPEMRAAFLKGYREQMEKGNALILVDYANRKMGKPTEHVAVTGGDSENPARPLTTEQLIAIATTKH